MDLTGARSTTCCASSVTGAQQPARPARSCRSPRASSYTWKDGATARTVDVGQLNGAPSPTTPRTYRIVTNNFLSDGGDNFPAFKSGTNKYFGGLDIDGVRDLPADGHSPYTPLPLDRITKQ